MEEEQKAVPEGNCPVPQYTSGLLGRIKLEEIRLTISEALDKYFDNFYGQSPKEMRATDRQPCLATESD